MNLQKYLLIPLLAISVAFSSCKQGSTNSVTVDPSTVQLGVSVATQAGLKFAITDAAKRANIANYIYVYSGALRTITNQQSMTPEELTVYLNTFVPQDIKTKYPEIPAFVTPMVVTRYTTIYNDFNGDTKKLYEFINAIASGLEQGASGFITAKPAGSVTPTATP